MLEAFVVQMSCPRRGALRPVRPYVTKKKNLFEKLREYAPVKRLSADFKRSTRAKTLFCRLSCETGVLVRRKEASPTLRTNTAPLLFPGHAGQYHTAYVLNDQIHQGKQKRSQEKRMREETPEDTEKFCQLEGKPVDSPVTLTASRVGGAGGVDLEGRGST